MSSTTTNPTTSARGNSDPMHYPSTGPSTGIRTDNRPTESPPEGASASADSRGISDLIKDLRDESMHLLRQEVNLAKTEIGEKAHFFANQGAKVAVGLGVLGIGALGLLSAAAFLIGGLLDWLFDDLNNPAAIGLGFLIVGTLVAIIGYTMYQSAKSRLTREPVAPERTIQSLKDDKQWLTNKTKETAHDLKSQVTG